MKHGTPKDVDRCILCTVPIWYLGGDPKWDDYDSSKGKPGTVGPFGDEEKEVPACLECANDRDKHAEICGIIGA